MEIRQLEHFVAVAEGGSFTMAAKRLNIAQSGLSMSIQALERALGVELFYRAARQITLTTAGQALLGEARRTLMAVQSARDVVSRTQGLLQGTFTLGTGQTSPPSRHLAAVLGEFRRRYPKVKLHVTDGTAEIAFQRLEAGESDLVVCGKPLNVSSRITTVPLRASPLNMICAPTHRLAGCAAVTLEDLREELFVDFSHEWVSRQLTERAFAAQAVVREIAYEVGDIWMMLELVGQGLGIAVAPRMLRAIPSSTRFVPIEPMMEKWQLVAAYTGDRPASAAASAFLEMLLATPFASDTDGDWLTLDESR